MIWQEHAKLLKEILQLDGVPVGVAFSNSPSSKGKNTKILVCCAFHLAARKRSTFNISAENSICPGGTTFLGLAAPSREQAANQKKFLIEGAKFCSSNASFLRARALSETKSLMGISKYVVIGPLDEFELKPDLVLFICNPAQASRLVTLSTFETGIPLKAQLTGSTCSGSIAFPISTGRINVSFIDQTTRHMVKRFKDSDLIYSVPYFHLRSIVESVPLSTAGTAQAGLDYKEILNK